jgi:hypothetical protein
MTETNAKDYWESLHRKSYGCTASGKLGRNAVQRLDVPAATAGLPASHASIPGAAR